jgi:hypothetical protein
MPALTVSHGPKQAVRYAYEKRRRTNEGRRPVTEGHPQKKEDEDSESRGADRVIRGSPKEANAPLPPKGHAEVRVRSRGCRAEEEAVPEKRYIRVRQHGKTPAGKLGLERGARPAQVSDGLEEAHAPVPRKGGEEQRPLAVYRDRLRLLFLLGDFRDFGKREGFSGSPQGEGSKSTGTLHA